MTIGVSSNDGAASASVQAEAELERDIGFLGATAIGVGTMIAGGIFVLSGLAVATVGAAAAVSFVLAAGVAGVTALTYAEFATIYTVDGGGYAYVDEVFDSDWSYLVGWLLALGYPASAAFYLASFADWFARFLRPALTLPAALPFWVPAVLVLALLVVVNLAGAEETGAFQVVVTALKVALVGLFLAGGLRAFQTDVVVRSLATNVTRVDDVALTAALVFITFFGFEAIATSEGEIESPERTVPRAIFVSIGFVTVLYVLVVVVVVLAINDAGFLSFLAERAGIRSPEAETAFLTDHGEAAMARAAQYYLGEAGFYVFVGGALLSMVSAANATVLAGSRVTLAMAERDQLPAAVGRVSPSTGAPTVAVGVTGGLILAFFLGFAVVFGHTPGEPGRALLGLESLAHFADAMLLAGLVFVNVALIQSRRRQPDVERLFRVPGVPWVPLLGVASNLALLASLEPTSLALAVGAATVGVLFWFGVIE